MDVSCGVYLQIVFVVMAFLLASLIFRFYWSHWKILSVAWKLPTFFPTFPIIGSCFMAARGPESAVNYLHDFLKIKIFNTYGSYPTSVLWIGPYPIFCVFDPDDIHRLLQNRKSFERGVEPILMRPMLGSGLITSFVDEWKVTRPQLTPMFSPSNLELLYPMINDIGRELVDELAAHVGSGYCNVEPIVLPFILKSTCKLIFGLETEVDTKSRKFLKFLEALTRVSEIVMELLFRPFALPTPVFNVLYMKEVKTIGDQTDDFIVEAIESSRNQRLVNDTVTKRATGMRLRNEETYDSAGKRIQMTLEDVYKVIQDIHPSFTDVNMIYEARTMLAAGTDTSRVILSACILALAAHPHIQEKLYTEIIAVTGAEDCDVTPGHIRAMPYLDQVLKETLRRFLTVPDFTRWVQEDLKLKDWTIPAGSLVAVFPGAVHYNPKFYPDPERFDPDRFSPENVAARGSHSFIPFGTGPRNCIGRVYAMAAMKTFLIHLLKKYRFSTSVDINSQKLRAAIVLGFKDGYNVEVEVR